MLSAVLMSEGDKIVDFVKDPSRLVGLCRDVINQISADSGDAGIAKQEAQLRAIAKAVDDLEKSGVDVPGPLRAEKTRIAAAIAVRADAEQTLAQLAVEFQDLLKDIRARLGQHSTSSLAKPRRRRSKLPKTPPDVLRKYILQALTELGGSARVSDVMDTMSQHLEGKLLSGDIVWRESTNEPAWQNNAKWERYQMTKDGALRQGSPRGIWELGEHGE